MWTADTIEQLASYDLRLPDGFLLALAQIENSWSECFTELNEPASADPLFFSATADGLGLPSLGFVPFWQENAHEEVVLVGCREPFVGVIGVQGVLLNEFGGLLSPTFDAFFDGIRTLGNTAQGTFTDICDLCGALAYKGIFSSKVSSEVGRIIAKERDGFANQLYGAISPDLALNLLRSDDFLEVEAACWRLAALGSIEAIPALEVLSKTTVERGTVDQHIRAAKNALHELKRRKYSLKQG
ncbi:hypothetical protein BC777_0901 [Yoonia maricola]|uniref:Uncharacterized protein n=1 Tax=Yoonia maricola TaxID=420999 RepID=A0A2M8WM96_9RHOB|nr:hypothetical protein [Yoonia maricola]PJI92057.1 hypothetical protein BC777_0901 [Yoonia maricola]